MKSVAIVGASANRQKFGNKAVRAYLHQGWKVFPVNPREKEIEGLPVYKSLNDIKLPIDRVSLYLPPEVGVNILPEISATKPKEVFVNPGAESEALLKTANDLGINVIQACSIIEVGESPSKY